jgi:hypothetical protein
MWKPIEIGTVIAERELTFQSDDLYPFALPMRMRLIPGGVQRKSSVKSRAR